ncbi:MAG TPA: hypothetical protein VIB82_00135 [Caulobacteraceae bacterium]|jgi:hypothetical protein
MRIIGLAMALIVAVGAPAFAAAATAAPISKDQRDKGMAAAPALVSAAGSDCQVADARLVGTATDPKTKIKTTLYEVACTGSEGLLVEQVAGQPTASLFTCMEAAGAAAAGNKGATQCALPGNADPKAGIAPFLAKSGAPCTADKIRAIGHSPTNTFFEVSCHEGAPGYVLELTSPLRLDKPAVAQPCIMFDATSNIHCELTDRAAQLAIVDRLVAASGKPCTLKDRGFLGVAPSGKSYYEAACSDGKGYVIEQNANGSYSRTVDCANADAIAGGCKLTDTRQAKTEQSGLYTQLAKKAGFDCTVSGYAPFSVDMPGKEVVELACSNRPDGGIALFPINGGAGQVYDCAHSELKSLRCSLTKPSAAYPRLTADLKGLGKATCTVSNSRVVGVSADQRGYIEVGCSDGLPGYMIEYAMATLTPKTTLVCAEAKGISGGCTLPGNKK